MRVFLTPFRKLLGRLGLTLLFAWTLVSAARPPVAAAGSQNTVEGQLIPIYKASVLGTKSGDVLSTPPVTSWFWTPMATPGGDRSKALDPAVSKLHLRRWIGPDGKRLPFESDEQVLDFLRTARVVSMKRLGEGITNPRKVLLERDGIQMHAIFRDVHVERRFDSKKRRLRFSFRDDCIFELAAYELSRLLDLDNVPPVVKREIDGEHGTLQIWIENAMTDKKKKKKNLQEPDPLHWSRQMHVMRVFDNLIYNDDRNTGNILIDQNWKLWMIDHTRAFRRHRSLPTPSAIVHCERGLWQKLQALDETLVKERLKNILRRDQIAALLKRRQKLIKYINKLMTERGESVIFTMRQS